MDNPETIPDLEGQPDRKLPAIPSGSLKLDIALGEGGIAPGQFVEISGDVSSGKTTLCQHIVAQAQLMGRPCAWIDVDGTFNPGYARRCGVVLEELYYAGPAEAEQALDMLVMIGGAFDGGVVVLDSIEALVSHELLDVPLGLATQQRPEAGDPSQRLLSLALRRLSAAIHKNQATLLFTSLGQRQRSEAYHRLANDMERLALRLQAGVRIRLDEAGPIRRDGRRAGQRTQARILKNKNIAHQQPVEFDIIYDQGINHSGEVFDLGLQSGLIRKQEGDYTFQGLSLGTGRQQAIETLERRALIRPMEQVIRHQLLRNPFLAET
jgi:recombination protein RecA